MVEEIRLEIYLDNLTADERNAAEEVMRLPGYTHADVAMAVQLYRYQTETTAKLDTMRAQLDEMSTPAWKKAAVGALGLAAMVGAYVSGSGQVPR